jgi:hypothetical protein
MALSGVYWGLKAVRRVLTAATTPLSRLIARTRFLREGHLSFTMRPEDVFIVTYPRSGTTLVQMMLYQLTSDGSMAFTHISEHCPWFERHLKMEIDFEALPSPRLFKSHLSYRWIPKGEGKYIYVVRDGRDVAVSYYHLYRSHNGFKGSFSDFFERFMRGKVTYGSWFDHVAGWWKHRNDLQILFLSYEELLAEPQRCVREIAEFCELEVDEARLPTILERCSFEFMKRHEEKFDQQTQRLWELGLEEWNFIRQGRMGEGEEYLSAEEEDRFRERYRKRLTGTDLDVLWSDGEDLGRD